MLTLDELFKKTAAKPCIYWLPLTGRGQGVCLSGWVRLLASGGGGWG